MPKLFIEDLALEGKRALIRVDFNVPQDKVSGAITNTKRIEGRIADDQVCPGQGCSRHSHVAPRAPRRESRAAIQPGAGCHPLSKAFSANL
jgi:hypothetical protein